MPCTTIEPRTRQGREYIAGEWKAHRQELEVRNPSDHSVIGSVPVSEVECLDRAVAAANDALDTWGNHLKWSWVRRAEVVDTWVQHVRKHQSELALLMAVESGKHLDESRADVVEAIHMLQYCAGRGRQPIGERVASEIPDKEAEIYLAPRGVCTVITPWNFPAAIPTWLIGPALVCGNPVVFKPSEETPLTAQYLVRLFDLAAREHGAPPGVLSLVYGPGQVGEHLVRHPDTVGQLFTGSHEVGSKVKQIAASHYDKFAVCEMGGKNSLIVLEDANLELAVNSAILSAYKTTHQRCVSADLLIVQKSIEPEFTRRFLEVTDRVRFGDPLDAAFLAGPLINEKAVDKFETCASRIEEECEDRLRQGSREGPGNFVRPNVFRMCYRPGTLALTQEFFTPNVVIVPVQDFEEAMQVAGASEYGLSMSLMTDDFRKMREFKVLGRCGLKYVNLPTIGAEVHLPFGGMKRSGTGMPSAAWLFNYMCHATAFTVNYAEEIRMAQGLSAEV